MQRISLLIILSVFFHLAKSQSVPGNKQDDKELLICCGKDASYMEFSSIAEWKKGDMIFLVPQRLGERKREKGKGDQCIKIVALEKSDIRKFIQNQVSEITKIHEFELVNFERFKGKEYQGIEGIEAAVAIGDSIYFSIEANDLHPCYIVMGVIDAKNKRIHMNDKQCFIHKPSYSYSNGGYESLVYLPDKKKLLVLYEKNHAGDKAFMLDLSLTQTESITIDSTIYFRVTDACNYSGDTIMAINHHYNGDSGEIDYYVGTTKEDLHAASKRLWGFKPNEESFTFLLKIYPSDKGGFSWVTAKTLQPGTDNWEGIIDFEEGFLIVTDALPSDASVLKSQIRYITLNR